MSRTRRHRNRIRLASLAAVALLLAACGGKAASLTQQGNERFTAQDYEGARVAYEQAYAARPDLAQTLYNLGNTEYRMQQTESAGRTLEEAANVTGSSSPVGLDADAWFNLGNVRFSEDNYAGAVDAYKESLRRDPADVDAKVNLELALRNLQQNEENQEQPPQDSTPSPTPTEQPQDQPSEESTPTPTEQGESDEEGTATPPPSPTPEPPTTDESDPATPTLTPTPSPAAPQDGNPQTPEPSSPSQSGESSVQSSGELTAEEARRILEAAAGDSQSLQQALQGTFPLDDPSVDKDW